MASGVFATGDHLELASRVQRPRTPSGPSARTTRTPPLGDLDRVALGETPTVGVETGSLAAGTVAVGCGGSPAAHPETATATANPVATTPRRMLDSNISLSSWLAPVAADIAATGN
jgi:hypothetical protein